jgi:TonB family protein
MKICVCLIVLSAPCCRAQSSTSNAQNPDNNKGAVAVLKLAPPVYPPLARQAQITGNVRLELKIRPDGSVAAVVALSGQGMFKQTAMESAQESQFSCEGCTDLTTYPMTYTFDFLKDTGCQQTTVPSRVRSPKCVYLWKCGSRFTTKWVDVFRPQEVSESDGHVMVFASAGNCVQPTSSHEGKAP